MCIRDSTYAAQQHSCWYPSSYRPEFMHCEGRCIIVSELPFGDAGARIGLIDYGQSKQLPMESKLAFAQLIHALDEQNDSQIGEALGRLGVVLEAGDPALTSRMAYGMFDTRGR